MTTVLFSSMERPNDYGDSVSNGGYKLQSLWIKLLRQHGVEAYRVTRDGTLTDWLIKPPPAIALDTAQAWIEQGRDVRVVTTWMGANTILELGPRPYWFDAELGHSACGTHFANLTRWLPLLAKVGTHSRTQQAWYMTMFGLVPDYIQEWSDTEYWKPAQERRERGRVGYMNEGPHTTATVEQIKRIGQQVGITARFTLIQGDERSVIDQMQACDVFLGLNPGKHPLFGEGCPRAQQEAMHCGCIVIAFDVLGNREYLHHGYTGFLVERGDVQAMGVSLAALLSLKPEDNEPLRTRSVDFVQHLFAPSEFKWQQVKRFLDL